MYAMFSKLLTAKAARKPAHWLLVNHHIIIISVPDTYNIANASITNAIIKATVMGGSVLYLLLP